MPQPTLSASVSFGGLPLPNGQGVMSSINLNDGKQWAVQKLGENGGWDYDNRLLQIAPYVYRARGAYLSDDWAALLAKVPLEYYEGIEYGGDGQPLGAKLAAISMAGEQVLSFDGVTGLLVKFRATQNRKLLNLFKPFLWSVELDFYAKQGWWVDLTPTVAGATTIGGSPGGTTTGFNVNYPGSVWCEPNWTLVVPNSNPAVIVQLVVRNTMSGEFLTAKFPNGLAATTNWSIVMNSAAMTITDQNGVAYDFNGSFPLLYGPTGQQNTFTATLTTSAGTTTGVTLQPSWSNRWML